MLPCYRGELPGVAWDLPEARKYSWMAAGKLLIHSNWFISSEVPLSSIHLDQHKTTFTETNGLPSSSIALRIKKIRFLDTSLDLGILNSSTL